jgi:hypothetical protein
MGCNGNEFYCPRCLAPGMSATQYLHPYKYHSQRLSECEIDNNTIKCTGRLFTAATDGLQKACLQYRSWAVNGLHSKQLLQPCLNNKITKLNTKFNCIAWGWIQNKIGFSIIPTFIQPQVRDNSRQLFNLIPNTKFWKKPLLLVYTIILHKVC